MSSEKKKVLSEDEVGVKLDRCAADTLLKLGGGLALGVVVSVVLVKRRTWPIWLGSGFGLGMGFSNCQNDLRHPFLLHGKVVKKEQGGAVVMVDERLAGKKLTKS